MTPRHLRTALLAGLAVAISGTGRAQVKTGTPPFGSFSGGPDIINNANLNLHVSIPVRVKAGRGMPFSYVLSYDGSVWYPVGVSGSQNWQAVTNWGWRGITEAATGYTTYNTSQTQCYWPKTAYGQYYHFNVYSNWVYHDTFGAGHGLGVTVSGYSGTPCQGYNFPPASASGTVVDGSGYSFTVTADPSAVLYSPSGNLLNAPLQSGSG